MVTVVMSFPVNSGDSFRVLIYIQYYIQTTFSFSLFDSFCGQVQYILCCLVVVCRQVKWVNGKHSQRPRLSSSTFMDRRAVKVEYTDG